MKLWKILCRRKATEPEHPKEPESVELAAGLTIKKTCSKCKQEKPLDEFHKYKKAKDGLSYWCKQCMKENKKPKGSQ